MIPFLGVFVAKTLGGITVLLLPGVFGFLVWELKENWRLYAANRRRTLGDVAIGHHGETMTAFLRPGIHSGTLPKLFGKLRQALNAGPWLEHDRAARKQLAALHACRTSIAHFTERTLCTLLAETGFDRGRRVHVGEVRLATNRIEIELQRDGDADLGLWLRFDDAAGWLTAEIAEPGWRTELPYEEQRHFDAALAGFYKLAGVDLIREQLQEALGTHETHIELRPEGLVLYSDNPLEPDVHYRLRTPASRAVPQLLNGRTTRHWPIVPRAELVFSDASLPWSAWVASWNEKPPAPQPELNLATAASGD